MKLLTVGVPCYNSQDYMAHCIDSLLPAGEEVEIIIVDDGSTDRTGAIGDEYARKYPDIVRVVHQENGGHGAGVMVGYHLASGLYYKVVDSDDWLDLESLRTVLDVLRTHAQPDTALDMVISNFIYDKVCADHQKIMAYGRVFPKDRVFDWSQIGTFNAGQVMLMHSIIYRTQLLRDIGLALPLHTFYEDTLYAAVPLPHVRRMYYVDVNLYHYYTGRADQSVNEKMLVKRIDQHAMVSKMLVDAYLDADIREPRLKRYLRHNMKLLLLTSSVGYVLAGDKRSLEKRKNMWHYVRERDPALYRALRFTAHGLASNLPGHTGRMICRSAFRAFQRGYGFN